MPAHKALPFLGESLPPLLKMLARGEVTEVLVVDGACADGTAHEAVRLGARVISTEQNQGPARTRNIGAKHAVRDVLWFVDADVRVHEDAARQITHGFSDNRVAALVGSYDDQPRARNFCSQYKNLVHHHYHQQPRTSVAGFWAGCGAIKAQSFADIGGYDAERLRSPSVEDIELGYRLTDAGGVIVGLPSFQGTHLKRWRLGELLRTKIFARTIPWSRLLLDRKRVNELNVTLAERARAVVTLALISATIAMTAGLSVWWALGIATVAVVVNYRLVGLFARVNGVVFAFCAIAFHQLYYLYASVAFAWVYVRKLTRRTLK